MSEYVFKREAVSRFHFTECAFDAATGVARLDYAFDTGGVFSETITFPGAPFTLDARRAAAPGCCHGQSPADRPATQQAAAG